jgi:hypothetical protein
VIEEALAHWGCQNKERKIVEWIDGWMDGWMGGWMDRWMDGRTDGLRNCKKTHTGCDYIEGIHCRTIYRLFTAMERNLGGHELEGDGEVEKTVTGWLITQDRN